MHGLRRTKDVIISVMTKCVDEMNTTKSVYKTNSISPTKLVISSTNVVGKNEPFEHWAEQLPALIYLIIKWWISWLEVSPPILYFVSPVII